LVEPSVFDHQETIDWYSFAARWPRPFRAVFLTHFHQDHRSGVDLIAHHLGVPRVGPGRAGSEEFGWQVLATPGHAPEHVCFWNGSVMVGGDMLYGENPSLVPAEGGDLDTYRRSASMLRGLNPKLWLPSHGRPFSNPDDALARAAELELANCPIGPPEW
jgi:glyoxylase-like metal-dependent hydrolase (beta-lactamase superfamily II)